jgi:hypothetical protein
LNLGTNYTIGPRASEYLGGGVPEIHSKAGLFWNFFRLEAIFLHQVAERAVGDSKHVGGLGLHPATLIEGTLQ